MPRSARNLLALACTCLLLGAGGARAYDWKLRWRTIRTDHFAIHYHDGLDEVAQVVAARAEQAHGWLSAALGWQPAERTVIVLSDETDSANGSSSQLPYRLIRLFASQPDESAFIDAYEDWMEMLITHEYTHSLHGDTMSGLPAAVRAVFGRITSVNAIHPAFMIEGLAVYFETIGTAQGRGRSAEVDMILRQAILEDRLEPIDRWTTLAFTGWPAGAYPYLFGGRLHLWIAEKYGHRFDEVSRLHGGQAFPFRYNANMERVFGKPWPTLLREFTADLRERYEAQRAAVEAQGITPTRRLTTTGHRTTTPRFSPGGTFLAWRELSPDHRPALVRVNLTTWRHSRVFEAESGGGFTWSRSGRQIVYAQQYVYRREYDYGDLYLYDLSRKRRFRLTRGARAFDPDLAPAGDRVVFIQNHQGTSDLALLDLVSGKIERLTQNPPLGPQYSSPRFSPDGTKVALSVREAGNRDIYLFDLATRAFTRLTNDPGNDRSPTFTPDGRTVLFSSDRTGIFNLFALDLETGDLFQVTNVLSGAFEPEVSPDGTRIAFTGYSADGYDIHLMDLDRAAWRPIERPGLAIAEASDLGLEAEFREETEESAPPERFWSRPYSPWATLWPRWWFPHVSVGSDEVILGAVTGGSDAIGEHGWDAAAFYYPQSVFAGYSVGYRNAQLYPLISVRNSLSQIYYGKILEDGDRRRKYYERRYAGSLSLTFPITHEFSTALGYSIEWHDALRRIPEDQEHPPNPGLYSGVFASAAYSHTREYPRSIAPERGGRFAVSASVDDRAFGSDYDTQIYTASGALFLGIPRIHHVFALSAEGGMAEGDRLRLPAFRLGGYSGFNPFNLPAGGQFTLRGYEPAAFAGQRVATGTLAYGLPIWRMERGIGTLPLFFEVLSGSIFADAGDAWTGAWDRRRDIVKTSVGAEVRLRMLFAFRYGIGLRAGVAWGLGPEGIVSWLVALGTGF